MKDIHMNKPIKMILIAGAIVIVSGGVTAAVLARVIPKNINGDGSTKSEKTAKQQAADANAKAKALLDESAKLGGSSAGYKKSEQAVTQFEMASKLSKEAGDTNASNLAQANADSLQSRLKVDEAAQAKLDAEHAKQKADLEASKAAFAAGIK
jgi:hypothetical protein